MATSKIEVSEEVIARACKRDSRHCMVAEAIQAANPGWRNISVDLATIRWTNPRSHRRQTALTPDGIRDAIFKFDQGEDVRPFSFTLKAIHSVPSAAGLKRGAKRSKVSRQLAFERENPSITTGGVVHGGSDLPEGHLGGTPTSHRTRKPSIETTEGGNVRLSGGRYRQYGLRQLKA